MGNPNEEINIVENEEELVESVLDCDTLKDCLLLGMKSANNREYTKSCLKEALPLYEGVSVYIDHSSTERKVGEHFGVTKNVRLTEKGIVGDLQVLVTHPMYAQIKESYDKNMPKIGLSQNAMGTGSVSDGKTIVNKISKVMSIDVVTKPATVKNLREQEEVQESVKEVGGQAVQETSLLEQEITSLKTELMQLKEQVQVLTESNKTLTETQNKWQIPKDLPLSESVKAPKSAKDLAKWLQS